LTPRRQVPERVGEMKRVKYAGLAAFGGSAEERSPAAKTLKEGGMKGQIMAKVSAAEVR
jgi:hypothetical protein